MYGLRIWCTWSHNYQHVHSVWLVWTLFNLEFPFTRLNCMNINGDTWWGINKTSIVQDMHFLKSS
jgi:hypothetical protein